MCARWPYNCGQAYLTILDWKPRCAGWQRSGGSDCTSPIELHIEGLEQTLHEQGYGTLHETTLFRIVQECLANAARHARPRHISISFRREQRHLCLCVADDGNGFDVKQHAGGLGLVGMRERAALLQGKLTIVSQAQQGTQVEVSVPCSSILEREAVHA